ncbi:MAG: GTPase Era [bacterium JZ-2024 1]
MGNGEIKSTSFRSGIVTIIGATNSGKSTLVNALVEKPVSIVSDKPQTTRLRTVGVLNLPNAQILLQDTPGISQPRILFEEKLVQLALESLKGSDIILFLVDATQGFREWEQMILKHLKKVNSPTILAINKNDLVSQEKIEEMSRQARSFYPFHSILSISALLKVNLSDLINQILDLLPTGVPYYPEGMTSNLPENLQVSEFIREKILAHTYDEIPYSTAVVVEEIRKEEKTVYISATIYVEEPSQKKIIIGEKGKMLKLIGTESRLQLEQYYQKPVFLDLWVKVKKKWRRKEDFLKILGY